MTTESSYFGQAEITKAGSSEGEPTPDPITQPFGGEGLREMIDHIRTWDNGKGMFYSWKDKVEGALAPGYPLFLRLCEGSEADLDFATSLNYFPDRKRRPSRNNPAPIALLLAAKPGDEPERKACSEYAHVYRWAAANNVEPADFASRVGEPTLKDIIKEEGEPRRRKRRANMDLACAAEHTLASPDVEIRNPRLRLFAVGQNSSASFEGDVPADRCQQLIETLKSSAPETDLLEVLDAVREVLADPRTQFRPWFSKLFPPMGVRQIYLGASRWAAILSGPPSHSAFNLRRFPHPRPHWFDVDAVYVGSRPRYWQSQIIAWRRKLEDPPGALLPLQTGKAEREAHVAECTELGADRR